MDKKCFIKSPDGCIIEDSDVIILTVSSIVATGLFLAGTAVFAPLLGSLSQLPRR